MKTLDKYFAKFDMLQCLRLKKREKIEVITRHAQAGELRQIDMDNIDKDNQAGDSSLDTELSDDDMDEVIKYTNDLTSDSNDSNSSVGHA